MLNTTSASRRVYAREEKKNSSIPYIKAGEHAKGMQFWQDEWNKAREADLAAQQQIVNYPNNNALASFGLSYQGHHKPDIIDYFNDPSKWDEGPLKDRPKYKKERID